MDTFHTVWVFTQRVFEPILVGISFKEFMSSTNTIRSFWLYLVVVTWKFCNSHIARPKPNLKRKENANTKETYHSFGQKFIIKFLVKIVFVRFYIREKIFLSNLPLKSSDLCSFNSSPSSSLPNHKAHFELFIWSFYRQDRERALSHISNFIKVITSVFDLTFKLGVNTIVMSLLGDKKAFVTR